MNNFSFLVLSAIHYLSVDQNQKKNNSRNDRKTKPGPFMELALQFLKDPPLLCCLGQWLSAVSFTGGVFHFRLSISPRPGKVIQLSSLPDASPTERNYSTEKPSDSAIVQQKQSQHLAKMCFPKQPKGNFQLYSISY